MATIRDLTRRLPEVTDAELLDVNGGLIVGQPQDPPCNSGSKTVTGTDHDGICDDDSDSCNDVDVSGSGRSVM
jgi:hypothetical protein